jgi:hypothetical protein
MDEDELGFWEHLVDEANSQGVRTGLLDEEWCAALSRLSLNMLSNRANDIRPCMVASEFIVRNSVIPMLPDVRKFVARPRRERSHGRQAVTQHVRAGPWSTDDHDGLSRQW